MSYRDDVSAKREEAERIARELRDVRRQMNEIEALSEKERELDRALTAASRDAGRARAKVSLPLLGNVRVASPCHERWEEMDGDARVRHCGKCDKNVYDLSAMTADAAESLLAEYGQNLCVRFYRRPDGTVMTADCPVGARRKRIRNTVIGVGAAAMSAFAGVTAWAGTATMGEPVMGDVVAEYPEPAMGLAVAEAGTGTVPADQGDESRAGEGPRQESQREGSAPTASASPSGTGPEPSLAE
jgi:hypothetical protein